MGFELPLFALATPEIVLLSLACAVLVLDVFIEDDKRVFTYWASQLSIAITLACVVMGYADETVITFSGHFISDGLSSLLKAATLIITLLAFSYSWAYMQTKNIVRGEFYLLSLFSVLGMLILISASSLLTIYLGLELLSLSLYALVAYRRDSAEGAEAAMKYFVLGALASGMLLYGMSMVYGVTETIYIQEIAAALASEEEHSTIVLFGLTFLTIGIAFKLGAVPFHMWVPDVYQGAPTSTTLIIGSIPKIAAFALVIRVLVDGFGASPEDWAAMYVIMIILSLFIGNVVAIAQTNIKRMLAYSTISHIGFLLIGIVSATNEGYSAAAFYAITYAITAAAAFGAIILLSHNGIEAENISDFKGLAKRSPWYAAMISLIFISMAGFPPAVGFYAKLLVLKSALDADLMWLVILAVVFAVIGAFYYLRVIKTMYFDEPESLDNNFIAASPVGMRWMLSANALAILVLGIFPNSLIVLCLNVFQMT